MAAPNGQAFSQLQTAMDSLEGTFNLELSTDNTIIKKNKTHPTPPYRMKNVPRVAWLHISTLLMECGSVILIALCSFYGWAAQKSSHLIEYSASYAHMSGLHWYLAAQDGGVCLLGPSLLIAACLQSPELDPECTHQQIYTQKGVSFLCSLKNKRKQNKTKQPPCKFSWCQLLRNRRMSSLSIVWPFSSLPPALCSSCVPGSASSLRTARFASTLWWKDKLPHQVICG